MTRPSPAAARLTAEFLAAIEAICAARVKELVPRIVYESFGLPMPPKRGRPRKERAL